MQWNTATIAGHVITIIHYKSMAWHKTAVTPVAVAMELLQSWIKPSKGRLGLQLSANYYIPFKKYSRTGVKIN